MFVPWTALMIQQDGFPTAPPAPEGYSLFAVVRLRVVVVKLCAAPLFHENPPVMVPAVPATVTSMFRQTRKVPPPPAAVAGTANTVVGPTVAVVTVESNLPTCVPTR